MSVIHACIVSKVLLYCYKLDCRDQQGKVSWMKMFAVYAVLAYCTLFVRVDGVINVCYLCTNANDDSCVDWMSTEPKQLIRNFTMLNFLPGTYALLQPFIINNAKNISIIGTSNTGTYVTWICSNISSFIITNSEFIEIRDIRFLGCGNNVKVNQLQKLIIFPSLAKAAIFTYNVSVLVISNALIGNSCGHGIIGVNIVGTLLLEYVRVYGNAGSTCSKQKTVSEGLMLLNIENDKDKSSTINTTKFDIANCLFSKLSSFFSNTENAKFIHKMFLPVISLRFHQLHYQIYINIRNTVITNITSYSAPVMLVSCSPCHPNILILSNITFRNIKAMTVLNIEATSSDRPKGNVPDIKALLSLYFYHFLGNEAASIFRVASNQLHRIELNVTDTDFINNSAEILLQIKTHRAPLFGGLTSFIKNTVCTGLIVTSHILLNNHAVVLFKNNKYNENCSVKHKYLIQTTKTTNYCIFQFKDEPNANITFQYNFGFTRVIYGNTLYGCSWISGNKHLPIEIFSNTIHFIGDQNNGLAGYENNICQCEDNNKVNCLYAKRLAIFPGQSITMKLIHSQFSIALYPSIDNASFTSTATLCNALSSYHPVKTDLILQQCTEVSFLIKTNSLKDDNCMLLLRTATKEKTLYPLRVNLKPCPFGFKLNPDIGMCTCDPIFAAALKVFSCNISIQSFKTAHFWMAKKESDIIYTPCIFDYCIRPKYSIYIDVELDRPDDQCAKNRSGIGCGQCAKGFSAVFGTFQCRKCSNYRLLLIPVFALVGVILVVMLFVLNLTVVDGEFHGFIFMVNSLSIHSTRIFPSTGDISYILISLSNLDLGFDVCFYNGMTQYAATWLRFVFPAYVFFIVGALAITSRYSVLIEKLTRKRVIPVIATLYLLCYNKIMLETFRGLFSFSIVHHLYSKAKSIFWAVDTTVPLLGIKFPLLLTFCLILFLTLIVPTNILLTFSKKTYHFRIVTVYLKPFLDVYHAPFKENCSHFLGIEFILRALLFSCLSFYAYIIALIYKMAMILYLMYFCWTNENQILFCIFCT